MEDKEFHDLLPYCRESVRAMNTFGQVLTNAFTPVINELVHTINTLPPDMKALWGDRSHSHTMRKKIAKARRLGLLS